MNFWYLLLFVVIGNVIIYLINWNTQRKPDTAWQYYAASIVIGGVLAYFIDEKVMQALLMVSSAIGIAWIIKGLQKVSKPN